MEISQELVKELFDYKNGKLYWKSPKSNSVKKGQLAGYIRANTEKTEYSYYVGVNGKQHPISRIIFLWHTGYLPKIVDHANRNRLDNHIENLREANNSENCKNRRSAKGSTSIYLGVSWYSRYSKWKSGIKEYNKTSHHIGYFISEEEAALAYNKMAVKLHGEFANLNIIAISPK